MTEESLIIIGAGLAGLSAGCYAQMNGYRSQIVEHHAQPGGVAAAWRRKDYLIDGGIHFVMGHKPGTGLYELYRELGIVPACRFVEMDTFGRFIDEESGRSAVVTADLDRLAADLKTQSPADAAAIDGLIAGARGMQGSDMSTFGLGQPPELSSPLSQLKELWSMRRFLRFFASKHNRSVADYTRPLQDPWLRQLLNNLFLPDVPLWFLYMLLALLADKQMAFLEGGCPDFVLPMEQRYRELGGQVAYKGTVEKILVENGRAVGVRLADGTEHRADAVLSAADGFSTIFKLLGGKYVSDRIRKRYEAWPLCRPYLLASFGVAREFSGEPPFQTLMLKRPLTVGDQVVRGLFLRILNYSGRFAPPGKAVIQASFEAEWDYWNGLQATDRARYDAEKERVAAEMLQRIEACYPGLAAQVEVTDVSTPFTTWRYTLNHKGAWGGWLMTSDVVTARFERMLPGLERFYMAGQWVTPGGGVPTSLYTGRQAVQLLCHHDRRPFTTKA